MSDQARQHFLEDGEFQSLLVSCLEKLERGETLDGDALIRQHPQFAEPLKEFLADQELLRDVAAGVRDSMGQGLRRSDVDETIASTPQAADFSTGDTIRYIGQYEILEEIARGGMGVVFKARQQTLKRVVALKMILAGKLAGADDVQRFHREAQAAGRLKHPNIVPVHEVGEHEGRHYFTMDFIDGRSLAEEIREESLPPRRAAEIVRTAAEAVNFAHEQGTIHRDLKPANVLLPRSQGARVTRPGPEMGRESRVRSPESENMGLGRSEFSTLNSQPCITDFGLAKMLQSVDEGSRAELTASGQILGTPSYMSPEQASGKQELVGPASDIYSLGAILYACLIGRAPFVADSPFDTLLQVMEKEPVSPRALNPSIPKDLETICLKCLSKEPQKRYGTAGQLADDLNHFLEGRPVVARPVGAITRMGRWCRRNPIVAGLTTAVVTLMLVVTAGSLVSVWKINTSLQREEAQRHAAETQHREAKRQLSRFSVSNAMRLLEEERVVPALTWFAEALAAEQDVERRARSHRTRIAAWVNQCPRLLNLWTTEDRRQWNEASVAGPRDAAADFGAIHDLAARFTADGKQIIVAINRKAALHYEYGPDADAQRTTAESTRWAEVRVMNIDGRDASVVITSRDSGLMMPAISADGRFIAIQRPADAQDGSANDANEVAVFSTATGKEIGTPVALDRSIVKAVFSPDGKLLATAASGTTGSSAGKAFERAGEVRIWNVHTGELASPPIALPPQWVNAIEFTPDGKRLVTGGPGARVWDVSSGESLTEKLHDDNVRHIAVSRDGRRLATAVAVSGGRGEVRVWNIDTSQAASPTWHHPVFVDAVVFSPDATTLLVVGSETVQVWNVNSGERLDALQIDGESLQGAAYSPDGKRVVTWGTTVRVWDAESWQQTLPALEHVDSVLSACLHPDSLQLLTSTANGTTRLWDLKAQAMPVNLMDHDGKYLRANFSPSGKRIITSNGDLLEKTGEARQWDVPSGRQTPPALDHPCGVWNTTFSGDGKLLFTASGRLDEFGAVTAWDPVTGRRCGSAECERPVLEVLANQNGSRIATFCGNSIATVPFGSVRTKHPNEELAGWNVTLWAVDGGGQTIRRLAVLDEDDGRWATGATISIDPLRRYICVARSKSAQIFHFGTGEPFGPRIEVIAGVGISASIQCAQIASDGRRLLTMAGGRTASGGHARIWDIESAEPLTAPFADDGGHFASFSPDGRRVVTCQGDSARVWEAATGKPQVHPLVHHGVVIDARFDPTGLLVATASSDRTVRIWDAETGQPVAPPLEHSSSVTSVAFDPEGQCLLTTATSGIARIWQLPNAAATGDQWRSLVHAISGGRIDETGTLVAIQPNGLQKIWSDLHASRFGGIDSTATP